MLLLLLGVAFLMSFPKKRYSCCFVLGHFLHCIEPAFTGLPMGLHSERGVWFTGLRLYIILSL